MIKLTTDKGIFNVHSLVSETTHSQFCDFCTHDSRVLNDVDDDKDVHMLNAVKFLVSNADELPMYSGGADKPTYTVNIFERLSVHDLYLYYVSLFNNYFDSVILPVLTQLDIEKLTEHQLAILGGLKVALSVSDKATALMAFTEYIDGCEVVDGGYRFEYKGDWYSISSDQVANYFGGNNYIAGEVVEVKEFRRKLYQKSKDPNFDTGEMMFKIDIHDVAVLARKSLEIAPAPTPEISMWRKFWGTPKYLGEPKAERYKTEKLPYDKLKRESFINERMIHFQDLPTDVVFNVCFFLINSLQNAIIHQIIQDSGATPAAAK